jgi:hypothetical protein
MRGDFTRTTFRPKKHYKSVLMQQGRVQLDADWNEHAELLLHRIETGTRDLLGASGGTNESDGFRIVPRAGLSDDFEITSGRYYVNGVLCENDETVTLRNQPDRRIQGADARDVLGPTTASPPGSPGAGQTLFLVYLDVWTRHITHLDDEELREPALGGADTTTRAKAVWQVRCEPLVNGSVPDAERLPDMPGRIRASTGTLEVRIDNAQLVNQLYRIEIDKSGARAQAAFKWSRDNGAVVALVDPASKPSGRNLSLKAIDRRFREGDWVEIVTETDELEGLAETVTLAERMARFAQIQRISGKLVVLDRDHGLESMTGSAVGRIKLRRWDRDPQDASDTDPPLFLLEPEAAEADGWIELENGVQIRFAPGDYKSGDYWYVPVRVGSETPEARPAAAPDGVSHHVAHLALVQRNPDGSVLVARDLRRRYIPPGEDRGLMYAGGDGQATPRGTVLPRPLAVYVTGYIGRSDVTVRFSLPEGAPGALYGTDPAVFASVTTGTSLDVSTDGDGMARCWWMPLDDQNGAVQPVTATLLEGTDTETGNAIQFNAWLSNADQVVYGTGHNAAVRTVEGALDDVYEQVTRLHHVSGNGQVASRAEVLPLPLVVELTGHTPASGWRVRFALPDAQSGGDLYALAPSNPQAERRKSVDITTDALGRAACYWRMPGVGSDGAVPPVTATLLDPDGDPTEHALVFHAWLSDADRVRYYRNERARDAMPDAGAQGDLQDIVDNLYENLAVLHYAGGDGQSGRPGQALDHPLRVRIANGGWASGNAADPRVRFRIVSPAGGSLRTSTGAPAAEVEGELAGDTYQCTWTLGTAAGPHEVEAFVYFDDDLTSAVTPVRFTAHVLASSEVMYDTEHNAAVQTVEGALDDLYDQVTRLHHVSGNGQVASRAEVLPLPLVVELTGHTPASGWRVRFALPDTQSDGSLYALLPSNPEAVPRKSVDVATDALGRATCYWRMPGAGSDGDVPPVTATLLDPNGNPTEHELVFHAWLSDADRVRYYRNDRARDAMPLAGELASLQDVIDNLYDNAAILHHVGGDGQRGLPGQQLGHPLRVRIGNGDWASGDAADPRVRFRIVSPAGGSLRTSTSAPATEIDGERDGDAYQCFWRLGTAAGPHEVEAFVYFDGDPTFAVTPLRFTAHVLASNEVLYDTEHNPAVQTVEGALDDLYEQVTRLRHVSGNGQVASRDEVLPFPLIVELTGHPPASGRRVRFALPDELSDGELYELPPSNPAAVARKSVDAATDTLGRAACYWRMPGVGRNGEVPPVTATLLDANGTPTAHEVAFHAWLSDADQVRYYLSERAQDAMPTAGEQASLQQVVDNLYANTAILHYAGGDGQIGQPGQPLARPLRVRIGNGDWAAGDAADPKVRFRIVSSTGGTLRTSTGAPAVEVDGEMVGETYQCTWTLGTAPGAHEVEAFVYFDGNVAAAVTPLRFTAHVLASSEVVYQTEHNAAVQTATAALDDLYQQVTRLHHVSGNGQVASRNEVLPLPLVVELTGHTPASGWRVRFSLPEELSDGDLYALSPSNPAAVARKSVDVATDALGRATCYWRMPGASSTGEVPPVTATLIDANGTPAGHGLTFHAWLSDADRIRYRLNERAQDAMPTVGEQASLQQIIDNMYENAATLHYAGGDGQSGLPGQALGHPLRVRIGNGGWAAGGAVDPRVRFRVAAGGGALSTSTSAPATEIDGELVGDTYQCTWALGTAAGPHEVEAFVYFDGNPTFAVTPLRFTAQVLASSEVVYQTEHNAAVRAAGGALDHLYEQVTRLHRVSGNGQVASRDEVLPLPLVVELTGHTPASGRQVRFALPDERADGGLHDRAPSDPEAEPRTTVDVLTDEQGRATCYWRMPALGSAGDVPPVTATLLDTAGNPTAHAVTFHAWLSDADRVRYYRTAHARDAMPGSGEQASLQQIIDNLYENAAILHYAGGDGQTGRPGQTLAHPLRVRIGNGGWAAGDDADPKVRFRVVSAAGGSLSTSTTVDNPASELDGERDGDTYQCFWNLGTAAGAHEVEAFVYFAGDDTSAVTRLRFTASVQAASGIEYAEPRDGGVSTVEQALRSLYANQHVLTVASGAGQTGTAGERLPRPLRVRLASGQWSSIAEVPQVRFTAAGGGQIAASQDGAFSTNVVSVAPATGEDGVYECWWRLGTSGAQEVLAEVVFTGVPNVSVAPVRLQAYLREASELHYENQGATAATTVKTALDQIFSTLQEPPSQPAALPVGAIVEYASQTAISRDGQPDGFLLCDGQEVPRDRYASLFAIIGESFGEGDGSSTFALPDLQGSAANLYKLIKC